MIDPWIHVLPHTYKKHVWKSVPLAARCEASAADAGSWHAGRLAVALCGRCWCPWCLVISLLMHWFRFYGMLPATDGAVPRLLVSRVLCGRSTARVCTRMSRVFRSYTCIYIYMLTFVCTTYMRIDIFNIYICYFMSANVEYIRDRRACDDSLMVP